MVRPGEDTDWEADWKVLLPIPVGTVLADAEAVRNSLVESLMTSLPVRPEAESGNPAERLPDMRHLFPIDDSGLAATVRPAWIFFKVRDAGTAEDSPRVAYIPHGSPDPDYGYAVEIDALEFLVREIDAVFAPDTSVFLTEHIPAELVSAAIWDDDPVAWMQLDAMVKH
ncbi:MAG: hypothetical protein J2P17_32325, partial [Mycobacterium sp.]|nr:hypothetical protein [Mycobacterium sp.]